ncbi:MAG: restriction endonuclease [Smithellaceae bacterium]|jgi:hypothetical protein
MPKIIIKGKSQLFFSDNDPEKTWRLKEKIVAVVESHIQSRDDLYTFSSQRIRNAVGDLEEVDVAFTNFSNPTDVFEFIQVRDRKNTAGRPWIEQILGQRKSLGINGGIMVSTSQFSAQAIRLAEHNNVLLRLLLPEVNENIRRWYKPDSIGIRNPIIKINKANILARTDKKILSFEADAMKTTENNILVPTATLGEYEVISLSRVFDVDIIQHEERNEELLSKIPTDGIFHKSAAAIEYKKPRLYLKVKSTDINLPDQNNVLPIGAIVFFIDVNHQHSDFPIAYRYKYIDAFNNEMLAQIIVAATNIEDQRHYICLLKHNVDGENMSLGGAFFQ